MKLCPEMCGVCTLACEDKYSDCPNWAEIKKCDTDAKFMMPNCPFSCGICAKLHDGTPKSKDEL